MNSDSIIPLVLALLCISAVGISSSTLTSSLSTEPEDVINPDYERLPLSQDDAERLREEVTSNGEQMSEKADGNENEEQLESPPKDAESQPNQEQKQDGDGQSQQNQQRENQRQNGETVTPPSLIDRLLTLLWNALPILALLVTLAALALLANRYSDRVLALLATLLPDERTEDERPVATDGGSWPAVEPENEVHGAWLTMVSRLDIEQPRTKTASECARAAVDAGMDPDAVSTLTRLFEEVRYGGAPVTESRRTQASRHLRRLGIESGTPL